MTALVFVEHDNTSVKDATLATVTAAKAFGDVHASWRVRAAVRLLKLLPRLKA